MNVVGDFTLHVESHDGGSIVWLKGELDAATSPQLDECLQSIDRQPVTIDFSALTFIDSSGISVLVRRCHSHGPDSVVVRGVRPAQRRVFEITRLGELLTLDGA